MRAQAKNPGWKEDATCDIWGLVSCTEGWDHTEGKGMLPYPTCSSMYGFQISPWSWGWFEAFIFPHYWKSAHKCTKYFFFPMQKWSNAGRRLLHARVSITSFSLSLPRHKTFFLSLSQVINQDKVLSNWLIEPTTDPLYDSLHLTNSKLGLGYFSVCWWL